MPGQDLEPCCPFCGSATVLLPESMRAPAFEQQVIDRAQDALITYLDYSETGPYNSEALPLEDPIVSVCTSGHVTAAWSAHMLSSSTTSEDDEGEDDEGDDEDDEDGA
jgi:hypothetical protein